MNDTSPRWHTCKSLNSSYLIISSLFQWDLHIFQHRSRRFLSYLHPISGKMHSTRKIIGSTCSQPRNPQFFSGGFAWAFSCRWRGWSYAGNIYICIYIHIPSLWNLQHAKFPEKCFPFGVGRLTKFSGVNLLWVLGRLPFFWWFGR